jgi:cyclophilin family peptidyl-prolyl cis-trans isomerase
MKESYHWYLPPMSPMMALVSLLIAQPGFNPSGPKIEVTLSNHKSFVIVTDKTGSPKTVQGILKLVTSGFYNGLKVHRVEQWLIQWGDPQTRFLSVNDARVGTKGSGHTLAFEGSPVAFCRGIVGIAASSSGVGGDSQIFILTKDALQLNGGYAVLGKIASGMDVVDHIKKGDTIDTVKLIGKG